MKKVKVVLPTLGEGIIEATLMQWLKKKGDKIEADQPIAEIATDKVDTEVLAPVSGIIDRLLFNEGDMPKVGDLIAVIEVEDSVQVPEYLLLTDKPGIENQVRPLPENEIKKEEVESSHEESILVKSSTKTWLSPLVRSIIKAENITESEFRTIQGTGLSGRVTRDDVMNYLKNRETSQKEISFSKNTVTTDRVASVETFSLENDIVIPMSRMRTIIAERMVQSKAISPHVTSFVEADVTNIVQWRTRIKDSFEKHYNEKITFTPIFVEAIVAALRQYPMINVSVSGKNIILHKKINIGMATALPSGDLIVPVIKDADEKNLIGLTRTVNDLSRRARTNQLKPDEIKGGTFTFTNVGTFNNLTGTPIINQPEVAILAIGAIKKRPAVIETPQGDTIGIRHMVILSLSYDHRVVDGALGGMFLAKVAEILENFDPNKQIF